MSGIEQRDLIAKATEFSEAEKQLLRKICEMRMLLFKGAKSVEIPLEHWGASGKIEKLKLTLARVE